MTNLDVQKARELIKNKPYLVWSTKNYDKLSPESILENVVNYGDWPDFTKLTEIFGIKQTAELFKKVKDKQRTNLRPQTTNYFTKYFEKHT